MHYGTLINAETLYQNISNPDWVIIDTRFNLMQPDAGYQAYREGHIENAHYAHLDKDLSSVVTPTSGRHPLPSVSEFESKCQKLGINQDSQVIVYDDAAGAIAARLWWLLKWTGHQKVAVLNGSLNSWLAHHYPLTSQTATTRNGNFSAVQDDSMHVTTEFIENQLLDTHVKLIDARDEERFAGHVEPIDSKKGHIPNAINIPFKSNMDANGLFLSPSKLTAHFYKQLGDQINPEELVCMCGSGVTACHNLLALEVAGFNGAKLYVGSWSEWIRDPSHPIE